MNVFFRRMTVFAVGGFSYAGIELIWRGHTHWSMLAAGGVCLLLMFEIFSSCQNLSLLYKALIGAAVITGVEFVFGMIFNYWFKMNVWDYSNNKFNILGQICPLYTFLWGILSIPASYLCTNLKRKFEKHNVIQTDY